ncbi:winged helix-turn-helix transcriptional regulator [Streptomyces sp. NBC_01298]|uniref:winged helix-turn-helix transcriptional regulator n=1 Tax=Streptomyces sp. NBC_01298 TaxID=2903817 RepID=UPI003FA373FD
MFVLAYVATHPGATAQQTAGALEISENVVARCLSRLTDDGLVAVSEEASDAGLRSYRLAE